MEILQLNMSNDKIIEAGMDMMVQCINFNVVDELDKPYVTLQLNVLGIIYGANIPKHELQKSNVDDAWKQIIQEFGVMHMMGQSKKVQDGSRELTDEEHQIIEAKK